MATKSTKITLKQLSQEIIDLLNKKGSGDASLEKEIISNVACGAAPSGTTFPEGQSFTEFAEKILRKDITPIISTSFTGVGIKEVGTIISGTTMMLNINNLKDITVPINEIKFYINNVLVDTQPFVQGQSKYSYGYGQQITTNTKAKAELIYNKNSKVAGEGSFTFVYASYYGATALSTIDSAIASNLANTFNKDVKNTKNFTWNNITLNDERFLYFYPKSFGALTSIKDGNNFEQIQSYTRLEVDVTSPINGDIVPYYAYLLTDSVTGTGFKQIYQ